MEKMKYLKNKMLFRLKGALSLLKADVDVSVMIYSGSAFHCLTPAWHLLEVIEMDLQSMSRVVYLLDP